jgi:tRNA G18 (ribose-2'-O)-methylase SpoU
MKSKNLLITVVLPDIRSSHNIGSIFRTSDAVGVSSVVLAGYSPRPLDKFNRPQKEIAKTALGAEKDIPWTYEESAVKALRELKKNGFRIVGVEQTKKSINYKDFFKEFLGDNKISKSETKRGNEIKLAIVFGNEVDGISKELLKLCDNVVDIPMKGNKESLNVSVSAGIILYELV